MASEDRNSFGSSKITLRGRNFLIAWIAGLLLLLLVIGWLTAGSQRQYRLAALERHRIRMNPDAAESGTTPADLTLPENADPVLVDVGLYVDRISELSIKDVSWTVDFYL